MAEIDAETLSHFLQSFSCPRNTDVETFLKSKSRQFERTHNARTYLIFDESDFAAGVYGYFSLSFKEIVLTGDVSKTKAKRLDGFSKHAERIRAFLIGQLGKNFAIDTNPLTLERMLALIFPVFLQAHESVGGRVILLECEDDERLVEHYRKSSFEILQKQDLVQMYLIFDPD